MFWIAVAAWLIGVLVSFINGKRKLPFTILFLGVLDIVGIFNFDLGWIGLSFLALLAVVILIANKVGS